MRTAVRPPNSLFHFCFATATFLASASLFAADRTVTSGLDTGAPGTLRAVIAAANPGDRILFGNGVSQVVLGIGMGELVIEKDLTIDGSRVAGGVVVSADQRSRVLKIETSTTVELISLTIRDGKSDEGASGTTAATFGENGGGILNDGNLTLRNCVVIDNATGDGGDATEFDGQRAGYGGGIYSTDSLTLLGCLVTENTTGEGGNGGVDGLGDGKDGDNGGFGGGIYFGGGGMLTIRNSTIADNVTGDGGIGNDRGGRGGRGGGLMANGSATVVIEDSTISGNRTGAGGTSTAHEGNDGGNGGRGGGLYLNSASLDVTITNSTISGNETGAGGIGGVVNAFGNGGDGGGIYVDGPAVRLEHVTITANRCGQFDQGVPGPSGTGGGIYQALNATVTVRNTVVAGNEVGVGGTRMDWDLLFGTIVRESLNCVGDNRSVRDPDEFPTPAVPGEPNINGDLVGTAAMPFDPQLGPLADNGGTTMTHAPVIDSPLVDPEDGDVATNFTSDQRGRPRPSGYLVDIGAVEFFFAPPRIAARKRTKTKRPRAKVRVRVISVLDTNLKARASARAKAKVRGRNGSYRVIVKRLKRKITRVRLVATDVLSQSGRKKVKILKR